MAWYDNPVLNIASLAVPGGQSLLGGYRAAEAQSRANRRSLAAQEQAFGDVSGMLSPYASVGIGALGEIQGMQDLQAPSDFRFDGTVQQYLDPSMQFQQQQMNRGIEASAAARGGLLSGAAAKELQQRGAQLAQTDYGNAFNRMQTDRNFAYGAYQNKFQMARQANSDRLSRLQGLLNTGYGAQVGIANARQGFANDQSGAALQQGNIAANRTQLAGQFQNNLQQMATEAAMAAYGGGGFGGGGGGAASPPPMMAMNDTISQQMQQPRTFYNPQQQFGTGGVGNLSGGFQYSEPAGRRYDFGGLT